MPNFVMMPSIRTHRMVTRVHSPYTGLQRYSDVARQAKSEYQAPVKDKKDEPVYVVTLQTTKNLHEPMNVLRSKYFPPERLRVGAHLTFFHALPESRLKQDVMPVLASMASSTKSFFLRTGKVRQLSHGIAIDIGIGQKEATRLRDRIQESWIRDGWLSKQDKAKSSMHYTIMNKVEKQEDVDLAMQEIKHTYRTAQGFANGLVLWRYENAGWEFVRKFPFAGSASVKQVDLSGAVSNE